MSYTDYIPDNIPDNPNEWVGYTGKPLFNAVYTVQLGELVEHGVFDWNYSVLNWKNAAYSDEQYKRVCDYFIERFYFREISMLPPEQWFNFLHRKLVYELCPKYNKLYKYLDDFDPAQNADAYAKNRNIQSEYPETLLSKNSDYLSSGTDMESENVMRGNLQDEYNKYMLNYKYIDQSMLDDLESMFIGTYSTNVNGW